MSQRVTTAKRIVDVWANEDPEHVEGGCADLSYDLYQIGQRLGWNIEVVTGGASVGESSFPHAWVEIDGELFDPAAYAGGFRVDTYEENNRGEAALETCANFFGVRGADEDWAPDYAAEIKRLFPESAPHRFLNLFESPLDSWEAAVLFADGSIGTGANHNEVVYTKAADQAGIDYLDAAFALSAGEMEKPDYVEFGFVDHEGNFLSREEAMTKWKALGGTLDEFTDEDEEWLDSTDIWQHRQRPPEELERLRQQHLSPYGPENVTGFGSREQGRRAKGFGSVAAYHAARSTSESFLNLFEMPTFIRPTPRSRAVDANTGNRLKDLSVDEVDGNMGILHMEKASFMFAAGFTMVWFFRTEEAAQRARTQKNYCPPMFQDFVSVAHRFSGHSPIKSLWKKDQRTTDAELDGEVLGALRAYVSDETIYLDMLSTRPGWKRNSIASKLVATLKKHFPGRNIEHSSSTDDGYKFLKATGDLQHAKKDGKGAHEPEELDREAAA